MENQPSTVDQSTPVVTFPSSAATKKGMPKWPFAAGGVLLILGIGGFFLMQSSSTPSEEATPTPYVSGLTNLETPVATSTPMATNSPAPSSAPVTAAVRSALSIEVQNGTGVAGDAAIAKKELDTLGYKKVTTGNASSTSATETTITYAKEVSPAVVAEITKALESAFVTVTAEVGVLSGSTSVRIVTGPKKVAAAATASAKPTATPTTKASASPSATPR